MAIHFRFAVVVLAVVFQLSACAGEKLIEPARPAPAPTPVTPKPPPPAPIADYRGPATRPFLMGFTYWPADLTDEGVAVARDYAHARGDIV